MPFLRISNASPCTAQSSRLVNLSLHLASLSHLQRHPKSKLYDGDLSYHTHFTHISRLAQMASHPHHVLTEAVSIQKGVQDRAQPSPT